MAQSRRWALGCILKIPDVFTTQGIGFAGTSGLILAAALTLNQNPNLETAHRTQLSGFSRNRNRYRYRNRVWKRHVEIDFDSDFDPDADVEPELSGNPKIEF